jgi:Ca2+-binding EF-hand superfamily protein
MAAGSGESGAQSGPAASQQSAQAGTTGTAGDCPARARVDADNDGTVSDQEARKHRDEVFASLDADKNNMVSKQEYNDCLASLQPNQPLDLTQSDTQGGAQGSAAAGSGEGAFARLDANSDGYVSAQEMMSAHKSKFEAKAQDGKIQIEQGSAEGAAGFEAADIDGDGTVTADEASATAALSFAKVDADSDGRVSSQEWSEAMQQQQAQQGQEQQPGQQQAADFTKAFNAIDVNSDGHISKGEFTKFGIQAFAEASRAGEPVTVWVYRGYYVY